MSPRLPLACLLALAACGDPQKRVNRREVAARDDAEHALDEATRARAEASAALAEAKQAKADAKAALDKVEKLEKAKAAEPAPSAPPPAVPRCKPYVKAIGGPKISFSKKGVEINGKLLGDRPLVSEVEAALGKADRVSAVANRIHVYEKLGVIAYQPNGSERIVQVTVLFAEMPWVFMPRSTFQGELTVDGEAVTPQSRVADHDLKPKLRLYVDQESDCLATVGVGFNAE